MAFTQDGISFIGTDGRDSLVLTTGVGSWEFPTGGPAFIEALDDDDQVTFNGNATGVSLVAGDGDDVTLISAGGVTGQLSESSINGNAGDDSTTWLNITNSSIYGGQGDDFLATNPAGGGVTTNASEINGNKGDDIISLTGSVTFTNVYGGQDDDFVNFAPTLNAFNNEIQGNKGDDFLNIVITGVGSSDNAVYGGADDDTIDAFFTTTDVLLSGDKGNDVIRGGFGDGDQVLSGGDDRDILIYTGNTATTMTGGDGPDVFRINAISAGDAPFISDFDTASDNIEINIDLFAIGTTTAAGITGVSAPFLTAGGFTGFFGATAQFGSLGLPVKAGTGAAITVGGAITSTAANGAYPAALGANFLQSLFVTPVSTNFTFVASALTGQLTDGNLFKAANLGQLLAQVRAAATGISSLTPRAALGFTQDSRRLFAFTNIFTTAVTLVGGTMITNTFVSTNTLAKFATNNVNGSDIFLV